MKRSEIKIYTAGKTWAAHWFQNMRNYGFNINARWIDVQQVLRDFNDEHSQEVLQNERYKREIWDNGCKIDCLTCDMMILACHPNDADKHSGSLVELGHVTGQHKPCYIIGTCASIEPVGHSDRAWKAQQVVRHWPEYDVTDPEQLLVAFKRAIRHYQRNYAEQWANRNLQAV
jgi:hypothetical protein